MIWRRFLTDRNPTLHGAHCAQSHRAFSVRRARENTAADLHGLNVTAGQSICSVRSFFQLLVSAQVLGSSSRVIFVTGSQVTMVLEHRPRRAPGTTQTYTQINTAPTQTLIYSYNNGQVLQSEKRFAKQKLSALGDTIHAHNIHVDIHVICCQGNGLPRFVKTIYLMCLHPFNTDLDSKTD